MIVVDRGLAGTGARRAVAGVVLAGAALVAAAGCGSADEVRVAGFVYAGAEGGCRLVHAEPDDFLLRVTGDDRALIVGSYVVIRGVPLHDWASGCAQGVVFDVRAVECSTPPGPVRTGTRVRGAPPECPQG